MATPITWKNSTLAEVVELYPPDGWEFFELEGTKKLIKKASEAIAETREKSGAAIYPPLGMVFACFEALRPENVKVIIIGQDPYHGPGQATGRAFAVSRKIKPPPSLKNIYVELEKEGWSVRYPKRGSNLRRWEKQGVLLLNTSLTVEEGKPNSHAEIWATFCRELVKWIDREFADRPVIFLLWGKHAQNFASIVSDKHPKVMCAHPSPFSARNGFFDSGCFQKVNAKLKGLGKTPIDWSL